MSDFNWSQFWVVTIIALLVGGLAVYTFFPRGGVGLSQSEVNFLIANATADKNAEIAGLKAQLAAKSNVTGTGTGSGTVTVIKETGGYLLDDLFLGAPYAGKVLSDREVSLFDGKVEFDGDDYNADETFTLGALVVKANSNDDFEGKDYLTVPVGSLSYAMTFESSLDTSDIGNEATDNEDETLTFNFLGKEVEVSSWDDNEITFSQGEKYLLEEGKSITVEGQIVELTFVAEDEVLVKVGEIPVTIKEGKSRSILGLEIKVSEILYSGKDSVTSKATFIIGKDVEQTVLDGDEYETGSPWVWAIDGSHIGLKLNEGYLDLDEDFSALAPKDEICLPNDYVCVRFNGLADVDREKYTFDFDNNVDYVLAKGDFVSGTTDYTKVYIKKSDGIIRDKIIGGVVLSNVKLGDTDSKLTTGTFDFADTNGTVLSILVNDFIVKMDSARVNVGSHDYDWMTDYGIFVEDTETALDDGFFTITVPEEQVSGSITVKDINFKEDITDTTTNSTAS